LAILNHHLADGRTYLLAAARHAAEAGEAGRVSLREIAKRAGLSPAACYRYFPSREALVDSLAAEVAGEIVAGLTIAAQGETGRREKILAAARAYLAFAVNQRAIFELVFETPDQSWAHPTRAAAVAEIGNTFGALAGRPDLGPNLWAAVHGLVDLLLKGLIDVGQREYGTGVLPSRGETLLRGLIAGLAL
jgi:AcrR family transcriptional regulator